jgi:hypothetical protein
MAAVLLLRLSQPLHEASLLALASHYGPACSHCSMSIGLSGVVVVVASPAAPA